MSQGNEPKRRMPKNKARPRSVEADNFATRNPILSSILFGTACTIVGGCAFLSTRYHVCPPTKYLVRTGFGITDMTVSKRGLQWPFQKANLVSMQPTNHSFKLACLSKQYLPFDMPVTYTLKPVDPQDDTPGFHRYCRQMADMNEEEFSHTVLGVIHGETRVLAANMDIDAINDDRDQFREQIVQKCALILDSMGLKVVNANIAELSERQRDAGQMGYLQARERKKLASAVQQSEIDVAQAQQEGDIGKKIREAQTRQEVSKLETETVRLENEQRETMAASNARLAEAVAESSRRESVAKIEAEAMAHTREQELQIQVEEARRKQHEKSLQASILVQNEVEAQALVVKADGQQEAKVKEATGEAESIKLVAQARADEQRMMLDAHASGELAMLKAKAEGELAMLNARAKGTGEFVKACNSDPNLIREVLWVQNEIPQELAKQNAAAVQGLNPQIWNLARGDDVGTTISTMLAGLTPGLDLLRKNNIIGGGSQPVVVEKKNNIPEN